MGPLHLEALTRALAFIALIFAFSTIYLGLVVYRALLELTKSADAILTYLKDRNGQ